MMVRVVAEDEFNKELELAGEIFKVIPIHKDDAAATACARGDPAGFERRRIWEGAKIAWAQSRGELAVAFVTMPFAEVSSFSGAIGILPGGKFTTGGILFICNDCADTPWLRPISRSLAGSGWIADPSRFHNICARKPLNLLMVTMSP